jgi:hypothetical protein
MAMARSRTRTMIGLVLGVQLLLWLGLGHV